jgi:geranylgeranyl reductase family protein
LIFDVAIVGAGPAGSSAAYTLENTGYNIVLIDKEKFPRPKPCAGVLPPRIFSEISIPENIVERPLEGYRIYSPSGMIVESEFPKPGVIVRRENLDDYLVQRLDSKPRQLRISDFEIKEDDVELKGKKDSFLAKMVIAADGANSIFHKFVLNTKPSEKKSQATALGVQYEISLPTKYITQRIGNWFEIFYTLSCGYGWISPLKDCVKVGIGGVTDDFKKYAKKILNEFLKREFVKMKIEEGKIEKFEAHEIPMKGPHNDLTSDRTLLCGDSGGFVFPGTGEGVYYAIKSGRIAAEVAISALKNGKYDDKFLSKCYEGKLKKNGLISLREVNFIDNVLSSSENVEKYVRKLKNLAAK